MLNINQNFDLKAPVFNFDRDYFNSVEELEAYDTSNVPDHFVTNVAGMLYQFTDRKWIPMMGTTLSNPDSPYQQLNLMGENCCVSRLPGQDDIYFNIGNKEAYTEIADNASIRVIASSQDVDPKIIVNNNYGDTDNDVQIKVTPAEVGLTASYEDGSRHHWELNLDARNGFEHTYEHIDQNFRTSLNYNGLTVGTLEKTNAKLGLNQNKNLLILGDDQKFEISRPIDDSEGATVTGIKSLTAFTDPSATKVWATDGSTVDLSTKANVSDLATKANKSDVLLAEDTVALVADAKNTAMEGKKTTILASTHVDSKIEFTKDVNLADGELHIKVNIDHIDIPENTFVHIIDISEFHVYVRTRNNTDDLYVQFEDGEEYVDIKHLYDKQFEIIVRKDGHIRYVQGDTTYITEYADMGYEMTGRQIKLIGLDTLANKCSYTCEIFQYDFPTLKVSQLDNDCNYIQQRNDDSLSVNVMAVPEITIYGISHSNLNPKITFTDEIYDENYISIYASKNCICLPCETYIYTKTGPYGYSGETSLTDAVIHCMQPIYKIVNSLPTSDIDSRNIYMIKKTDPTDPNIKYDKYIYISEDKAWEKIG